MLCSNRDYIIVRMRYRSQPLCAVWSVAQRAYIVCSRIKVLDRDLSLKKCRALHSKAIINLGKCATFFNLWKYTTFFNFGKYATFFTCGFERYYFLLFILKLSWLAGCIAENRMCCDVLYGVLCVIQCAVMCYTLCCDVLYSVLIHMHSLS